MDALFAACSGTELTSVYLLSDMNEIIVPSDKHVTFINSNKRTIGKITNNGELRVYLYPLAGTNIVNNGILKLENEVGDITNSVTGSVNFAGSYSLVTGTLTNNGTILSIGQGVFLGDVINNGTIGEIVGGSFKSTTVPNAIIDKDIYGLFKTKNYKHGDIMTVYKKADIQASVGEYYYPSWWSAMLASTQDSPAKLYRDVEATTGQVSLNVMSEPQYYVDLNGKDLTLANYKFGYGLKIAHGELNIMNTKNTGKIKYAGTGFAFMMSGGVNDLGPSYSVLNVGKGVTIDAPDGYGIAMASEGSRDKYGVEVKLEGTINAKHGIYINGGYSSSNGSTPVFNLTETSKLNGCGIYAAGYATWTLAGDITAHSPVYIKSGVTDIINGNYTAIGEKAPYEYNSNGAGWDTCCISVTAYKQNHILCWDKN